MRSQLCVTIFSNKFPFWEPLSIPFSCFFTNFHPKKEVAEKGNWMKWNALVVFQVKISHID